MAVDETQNGDSGQSATDNMSFGVWLKHLRETRKITLEEIAAVTKIHITQLKYLEADEQEKLPAPAFIRGFLTSYSRHLKIDEDEVLERFSINRRDKDKDNPLIVPVGSRAAQSSTFPKVRVVTSPTFGQAPGAKDLEQKKSPKVTMKGALWGAAALAVIASLTIVVTMGKKYRLEQKSAPAVAETAAVIPPVSAPAATSTPAPVAESKAPAAPVITATTTAGKVENMTPLNKKNSLELRALEQSWVNVRIDDGDSKGVAMKGGKAYSFSADRRVFLSLSNAGGVEIRWNGQWFAAPGFRGDVKSLTLPDQLPTLTPRAAPATLRVKPATPPPAAATPPPPTPGTTD